MDNLALISLLFLISAVALGFIKGSNVGIVAISAALILSKIGGISEKALISGFGSSLFIMLLGITYLFSIVQTTGALDLFSKKFVMATGKNIWLTPIAIYVIGFAIAAVGPGAIPALAIVPALGVSLALAVGYNPLMLSLIGVYGLMAGRMTPITPEGVLITELAAKQGITEVMIPLLIAKTLTTIIIAVGTYVIFKGYKVRAAEKGSMGTLDKFNSKQLLALCSILVMLAGVIFLKLNVGLCSFLVGTVLILLNVADEGKVIKSIPWSTLILITGVGMLMSVVTALGGIELLSTALASIMNGTTACAIMGVTAGVMSYFSSALGVVFPTLIPTVATVAETVGGKVTPQELITAIGICGSLAGLSPASSGGALIMAAIATNKPDITKEEQNKIFVKLLFVSIGAMSVFVVLALLGVYRMI